MIFHGGFQNHVALMLLLQLWEPWSLRTAAWLYRIYQQKSRYLERKYFQLRILFTLKIQYINSPEFSSLIYWSWSSSHCIVVYAKWYPCKNFFGARVLLGWSQYALWKETFGISSHPKSPDGLSKCLFTQMYSLGSRPCCTIKMS